MKAEVNVLYYYDRDDEYGELHQIGFLDADEVEDFLDLYGDTIEVFDLRTELRDIDEDTGRVLS